MNSFRCFLILFLYHLRYLEGRPSNFEETTESSGPRKDSGQGGDNMVFQQEPPWTPRFTSGVMPNILTRHSIPMEMQPRMVHQEKGIDSIMDTFSRKLDFDWPAHEGTDIPPVQFHSGSEKLPQGQDDDSVNHRYQQEYLSEGNGKDQTHNRMTSVLGNDWDSMNRRNIAEEGREMLEEDSTLNFSHHQEKEDEEDEDVEREEDSPYGDITKEWERDNGRQERLSLNHLSVSRVKGNTNVSVIHSSSSSTSNYNSTHNILPPLPSTPKDETISKERNHVTPISGISPVVVEEEGGLSSHSLVYLNQGQGHSNDIDYDKGEVGQDDDYQLNAGKTMNRLEACTGESQATAPFSFLQSLVNKLVCSSLTPIERKKSSSQSNLNHVQREESIEENQAVLENLLDLFFQGSQVGDNDNSTDFSIHHVPVKPNLENNVPEAPVWESPEQNNKEDSVELQIMPESWLKEKQKTSLTSSLVELPKKIQSSGNPSQEWTENYAYDENDVTDMENTDDFEVGRSGILGPGPAVAVIAAGIGIALYVYGRTWRYVIPNEFALTSTLPPLTTTQPTAAPASRSLDDLSFPPNYLDAVIPRPDLQFNDEILFRDPSTYIKERKPSYLAKTSLENFPNPVSFFFPGLWR